MTQQWKKVIRDLMANKSRTILVVMAIAVGVVAFGSVFTSRKILVDNMNIQYRAINPSSININIEEFDDQLVDWVKNKEDITGAIARSAHSGKITVGNKKYNVTIYGYDRIDNLQINKLSLISGYYPQSSKEVMLERRALPFLQKNIGDYIEVELPDGTKKDLKIVGTVHDLTTFPASMYPELSAYTSLKTITWMGFDNKYNQLNLTINPKYKTLPELEKFADQLKDYLVSRDIDVLSISAQRADEHWAKDVTSAFVMILTVIGTFSLILSAFLVVNTISAVLAQQKKQIGILKAIGGTRKQIIGIYLVMALVYGLLGLVIALPLGYYLGFLMTKIVSDFLNVDVIAYYIPSSVLLMMISAALLVPLLSGLLPVLTGTKISVREALSDFSQKTQTKSKLMERLLFLILLLPKQVSLAVRNIFRQKFRLIMTLGTLTIAGMLLISVINVKYALESDLFKILKMYDFDIQTALGDEYSKESVVSSALSMEGVRNAEGRLYVSGQRVLPDNSLSNAIFIAGIAYDSPFTTPTIMEGRWLEKGDKNSVVISSGVKNEIPGLKMGDQIKLRIDNKTSEWTIVGVVSSYGEEKMMYADIDYLGQSVNKTNQITQLLVKVEPYARQDLQKISDDLENELNKSGIEVSGSTLIDTILAANKNQYNFLIYFLLGMAVMVGIVRSVAFLAGIRLAIIETTTIIKNHISGPVIE